MTSNQAVQIKEELLDIIDGEMGDLALELDLCTDDRLWRSLRLISITFGSIAEGHLRVLLTLSGINLTEAEDFQAASIITTAFAVEGVLEIRDLLPESIVDYERYEQSPLAVSEDVTGYLGKIKTDGVFFREIEAPELYEQDRAKA